MKGEGAGNGAKQGFAAQTFISCKTVVKKGEKYGK